MSNQTAALAQLIAAAEFDLAGNLTKFRASALRMDAAAMARNQTDAATALVQMCALIQAQAVALTAQHTTPAPVVQNNEAILTKAPSVVLN